MSLTQLDYCIANQYQQARVIFVEESGQLMPIPTCPFPSYECRKHGQPINNTFICEGALLEDRLMGDDL